MGPDMTSLQLFSSTAHILSPYCLTRCVDIIKIVLRAAHVDDGTKRLVDKYKLEVGEKLVRAIKNCF